MITLPFVGSSGTAAPRRALYRQSKRLLSRLLTRTWAGQRGAVEPAIRRFLRGRPCSYLVRLVEERSFALAAAASLLAACAARALPPVDLADVAAGDGGFVINGIDRGEWSGSSVSGAGDVNGDDVPDVIVGGAGKSYVVFGKADGTAVELADVVAGTGGFVINGGGSSVSGAGDVNGDDVRDVIVGAPGGSVGAGKSYVVFGKADGTAVELADVAAGTGGFVIRGIDPGDYSGWSVSGAGDVNGDGLTDVIVGAPYADPGGNSKAGESYVVFGKADGTAVGLADVAAGTGGFVINGIDPEDRSGWSVSGAGDVNGDGLPDLIVGAFHAGVCVPFGCSGESYVIFGKADGTAVELADIVAGTGGFVINGDIGDGAGRSVSDAGDVNGDGLADVIVGAPGPCNAFTCNNVDSYVVFGKADGTAVELAEVAAGAGGFIIDGRGSHFPSVSGAGDVNGDGLDDVIVGLPGVVLRYDVGCSPGESYVVFGKADGTAVDLPEVAAGMGGFVMTNETDPCSRAGASVSGAGDVDGDGLADVIVGAPGADPGGNLNAGESYVVFSPVPACPWDCDGNGDGIVSVTDLLALLAQYDPMSPVNCTGGSCDYNEDGCVDVVDLLKLLAHYDSAGLGCP